MTFSFTLSLKSTALSTALSIKDSFAVVLNFIDSDFSYFYYSCSGGAELDGTTIGISLGISSLLNDFDGSSLSTIFTILVF